MGRRHQELGVIVEGRDGRVAAVVHDAPDAPSAAGGRVVAMLGGENVVVVHREGCTQRPAAQGAASFLTGHQLRELATIEALARCGGLARISGA